LDVAEAQKHVAIVAYLKSLNGIFVADKSRDILALAEEGDLDELKILLAFNPDYIDNMDMVLYIISTILYINIFIMLSSLLLVKSNGFTCSL